MLFFLYIRSLVYLRVSRNANKKLTLTQMIYFIKILLFFKFIKLKAMKKAVILLISISISTFSFAQLTETIVKPVGSVYRGLDEIAALSYKLKGSDTIYTLRYKDPLNSKETVDKTTEEKHKSYLQIIFSGEGNALNTFYNILIGAFNTDNIKDFKKTFNLGENSITVEGGKLFGKKYITIFVEDVVAIFMLNQKGVNFLFGKAN